MNGGEPAAGPLRNGPVRASSAEVASRMSRQRRLGTVPELALRRELHRLGLRYRIGWPVPGRPRRTIDVAFPRRQVAVFVDGCFWHACPEHATSPKANGAWWSEKLAGNVRRDRDTDAVLIDAGWAVVRVWEHEAVSEAAVRVVAAVRPW
nr:very short patch repair endonuclease [Nocardioides scoriae]